MWIYLEQNRTYSYTEKNFYKKLPDPFTSKMKEKLSDHHVDKRIYIKGSKSKLNLTFNRFIKNKNVV